MNSDADSVAHLSFGPQVNGQQNLTDFVKFFYHYPWMIFVDMPFISVEERCL